MATIIGQLCQSHAIDQIATTTLAEALERGVSQLRNILSGALSADARLLSTGIEILGCRSWRSAGVRRRTGLADAGPGTAPGRGRPAVYERRAVAVERERTISENEMASQIELATRREHLVAQEGANARRQAEEKAAAGLIEAQASAERKGISATAEANQVRMVGEAAAAREAATMEIYSGMEQATLLALALRDAAGSLPNIGNLTITPDLLSGALAGLFREPAAARSGCCRRRGGSTAGSSNSRVPSWQTPASSSSTGGPNSRNSWTGTPPAARPNSSSAPAAAPSKTPGAPRPARHGPGDGPRRSSGRVASRRGGARGPQQVPAYPEDVIAVVGQDGLVANTAKYLNGQPVIGIDPEPGANPGVLVRHSPEAAAKLLHDAGMAGPLSGCVPGPRHSDSTAR